MSYSLSAALKRLFLRRQRPQPIRRSFRPKLESLEDRYAPAVLMVTNSADDGSPGSLRTVVSGASNGDVIHFSPLIAGSTIKLTSGQINLNKSLTIDGQTNKITIDGGGSGRIFYNPLSSLTEEIDDLTLSNGKVTVGGAPDFGNGGAIYDLGNLTLNQDAFLGNQALSKGGAVYNAGGTSLNVSGCVFTGNLAPNFSGGAIYIDFNTGDPGVNIVIYNSTFQSNHCLSQGGAIDDWNPASTNLTVTGCTFSSNGTDTSNGGAIYVSDANLKIVGGAFTSNTAADSGGAVYDGGTATLQNITFTDNMSKTNGGAVASVYSNGATGGASLDVSGCTFYENQAVLQGGGLYVNNTTAATASARATVFNSTFYKNSAEFGGGIALSNANSNRTNSFSLYSLTVYENSASTSGGGLWLNSANSSKPLVTNDIFAGNVVENPPSFGPDVFGTVASASYNLVGETDGSAGWNYGPGPNVIEYTGTSANPKLAGLDPNGLANNGGTTQTIKVLPTSLAFRDGNRGLGNTTDQRGYNRAGRGMAVTIGAYDPDATPKKVGLLTTSISVASNLDPAVAGQTVQFTVTVTGSDGGAPSGSVTFLIDGAEVGTATLSAIQGGSQATFSTSDLAPGVHDVMVVYSGDDTYDGGIPADLSQIVDQETSVSLTSNANQAAPGQAILLTASVTGYGGPPTGTVTFLDGQTVLGTAAVTPGGMGAQATFTTSALSLGSHYLTAVYSGDPTFAGNTSPVLTENVQLLSTSTSLTSSINPSTPGQSITLTGSVEGYGGGPPTGSIQFFDGSTLLATVAVTPGGMGAQAAFNTTGLSLGSHSLRAVYSGDAAHAGSSGSLTQNVRQASAMVYLSGSPSNPNPSAPGQAVTFTVSFMASAGAPTGSVTFTVNGTAVQTVTLPGVTGEQAVFTTSALGLGANVIKAAYSGDAVYAAAVSNPVTQNVQMAYTSVSLSSGNSSSPFGSPVTFTATIMAAGSPSGTISFYDGTTLLAVVPVSNRTATYTTSALTRGSHSITAVYSGDLGDLGGTSSVLDETIY